MDCGMFTPSITEVTEIGVQRFSMKDKDKQSN